MTQLDVQETVINETNQQSNQETKTKSVDVMVITCKDKIFDQIKGLIKEKNYTWTQATVTNFRKEIEEFDSIGTVVIETSGVTKKDRENFCQSIRHLESKNIAAVLINNHINFPVGNYDLISILETGSIGELRGVVSANIAHSKKLAKTEHTSQYNHAEEMEEQLKMAGQVQRDFLPEKLPNDRVVKFASIFQPAEWVSGDIFDARRLDEQHISFYIADAVGHSMPAALLTMFLKQAMVMRETTDNDYRIFSPAEVISNLNNRMVEQRLSGSLFATCCYCLLNTKTMQMQYARAGHPYPLLISKDNKIKQLQSRGSLLGVFENAQFIQETVQLQKGDRLFMYSDGAEYIIGNPKENGEMCLNEDFHSITELPIDEMVDMFDIMVRNRTLSSVERDDITILGLEIL